jgi:hypothetical protein
VLTVLQGWRLANLPDAEMEARGIDLFEGLYAALMGKTEPKRKTR